MIITIIIITIIIIIIIITTIIIITIIIIIKKFWQAYTTPAVRNVISLPLEFGSDEYVFEPFASFIQDNRRLLIYLTS